VQLYAEEWILKALVGFKFYWTMAFFELVVFAVITYAVTKGLNGGNKLEPRAAPIGGGCTRLKYVCACVCVCVCACVCVCVCV
jgi:hypothetical protein